LVLWFERAQAEIGIDKLRDLQLICVPHAERPEQALISVEGELRRLINARN